MIDSIGDSFAATLAALHADAFAGGEMWGEDAIRAVLIMPGTHALLARRDHVPLGFVIFRQTLDEAEIVTLAVTRKMRRLGVGRALVVATAGRVASHGGTRIFLEVATTNDAARGLYESLGYVRCGFRRCYYADGGDALVLAADLRTTSR